MVAIKDVAEVIKMLGDVVKSTREIVKAVNDGTDYLKTRFPDARDDLASLLAQMRTTITGLANVTKVISAFRFVYHGSHIDRSTADRELARFNQYTIEQKVGIELLRTNIGALKANCEKVRELRDKLDARTSSRAWGAMFGLLGEKAQKRQADLHSVISNFYADDQRMIEHIKTTLSLAESAIDDVNGSLGPPGTMNPYLLPDAATLLGTYAVLFKGPTARLRGLAEDLEATGEALLRR